MKALIVYCHPSGDSFTREVRDAFIKGITDSGHEYILSDLYAMDFRTDMSEKEYLRDAYYRNTNDLAEDVLAEQEKVNAADAIVLIYPVFWTEAPAKLVGWFDRVWSYGFAYGEKRMKTLEKGLILCTAGNTAERLEQFGLLDRMKKVMFGDLLFNRIRRQVFVVFDGMTIELEQRERNWEQNLETAYEKGTALFDSGKEPFSVEGRFFTAVENSESGEVSGQTVFSYHQKGNAIWAEYSGGSVVKGFLVGTMDDRHCLHFTYQHINQAGEQKAGTCDSEPREAGNRLQFHEKWKWTTGGEGTSIIEEI